MRSLLRNLTTTVVLALGAREHAAAQEIADPNEHGPFLAKPGTAQEILKKVEIGFDEIKSGEGVEIFVLATDPPTPVKDLIKEVEKRIKETANVQIDGDLVCSLGVKPGAQLTCVPADQAIIVSSDEALAAKNRCNLETGRQGDKTLAMWIQRVSKAVADCQNLKK